MKNETKKLLEVVGNVKKTAANASQKHLADIARLAEEVATLKDGKNLLEKKSRCCTCASVLKGVKGAAPGDLKTDQISTTAKTEIQKLVSCAPWTIKNHNFLFINFQQLEELKLKDREISSMKNQLKKKQVEVSKVHS